MLMMDKILNYVDSSVLRSSVAERTRARLRFSNRSWIIALPCGRFGHTLRGHTAHLIILDEAAFIPEEVIANVVLPMIATTRGAVWMISTPWDKDHIFYRAFTDGGTWSVYQLPTKINPLVPSEFLEEQYRLIGEERFRREYDAQFIDDSRSYFPMTLLRNCIASEHTQNNVGGSLYCGYDPGGKQDYAAFVALSRCEDYLKVELVRAEMKLRYTDFDAIILDYKKQYRLSKVCVDQTGLGAPIVEHLKELQLDAEGIVLTDKMREELLSNLKILLEQRKIILPEDTMLLSHLNSIEFERTRVGGFRFSHRRGTHDDLAYALALACWASRTTLGGAVAKF